MLVLFETAAGYALFKVKNENKLQETDNIWKEFQTADKANGLLELMAFKRFKDTADALAASSTMVEGKLGKSLKKFLKKCVIGSVQDKLAVADSKLGNVIKEKLAIPCVSNSSIHEVMRGIRTQLDSLIADLPKKELTAITLGLAHSLSRYKLKFNPEKIDTMIIQAVSLLDDLDKELNNYIMRCREWYGWHFPEMVKLIQDHIAFAKTVNLIGMRENTANTDLSSVLPEELEQQVKEASQISMGTEISELDIMNIRALCDQIIEISDYRSQLYDYLKNRMMALAPNVTTLLGELVAARLISHAGSLMNLAKYPASTVQILGAEKALFRALKTKKDTPKYGLIYHAQLIGQAPGKLKGKISRMLAAKAALACRVDALGEDHSAELGIEHRATLEKRIQTLQYAGVKKISGLSKQQAKHQYKTEVATYDTAADSTIGQKRPMAAGNDLQAPPPAKRIKQEPVEEQPDAEMEDEAPPAITNGAQIESDPDQAVVVKQKKHKKKKSKSKETGEDGVGVKEEH